MKTIEENIEAAKLYISEAAKAELRLREEGRRMERHELLRWRDSEVEQPLLNDNGISVPVLSKVVWDGNVSYRVVSFCKNQFYPRGAWFNPDKDLSVDINFWRPIEEE